MPENRGSAVAATTARGHRPLPTRPDTGPTIRPAHQPQEAKPSGFNWDWNKAPCTGCQTKVTKSSLADGQCPTCRGVEPVRAIRAQPTPAPVARKKREHSKTGDQVYEHLDDAAVRTRFEPVAPLPDVDTESVAATQDPSPVVDRSLPDRLLAIQAEYERDEAEDLAEDLVPEPEPEPPPVVSRRPLKDVDLLEECVQHAARTLRAAHGIDDPLVGSLRSSALTAIAALDFYLAVHCTTPTTDPRGTVVPPHDGAASQTTQPASPGLGGNQPAAGPQGEGGQQPAPFQTFEKPRPRSGRPRSNLSPETIADVVRRYRDDQQSLATIMADTGMGKILIRRILTDAGVTIRPSAARPTELSAGQQAEAVDLYLQGGTLADVGRAFHVHARTVRDLVRAAGHPIHAGTANAHTIGVRLRDLGLTSRQVKDWAVTEGILPGIARGSVAHSVIDAYETAHPTQQPEQEGPAA